MRVKFMILLLCFLLCVAPCSCTANSTESSSSLILTPSRDTYSVSKESNSISEYTDSVSEYADSVNEDTIPSSEEMGSVNHGVIYPDPIETNFTLIFDGNPIELTYMIENGASSNFWGLSIFVNGKQQPFSVNDDTNILAYNSKYDVNERKDLNIKFVPISGEKGETITVYFVVMVNPEYVSNENNIIYGYNHTITQMPWKLYMNADSPQDSNDISFEQFEVSDISKSYKENYQVGEENGSEICLLDFNTYIEFFQSNPMEDSISLDDNMALQINIAGSNEICDDKTFYRISVYVDHQPIECFDGKTYADVCVERNKLSSIKIELKTSDLAGKSHIYLMAIPIKWTNYDSGILSMIKTETKSIKQ